MYQPQFVYTSGIARTLMRIERYCVSLNYLRLPTREQQKMQYDAKLKRTHFSTSIEGNVLSYDQVERAIQKKAKDCALNAEREVINYWDAMNFLDEQHKKHTQVTEAFIQTVHGYITKSGQRVLRSEYRQATPPGVLFAVFDSVTRQPEYIPPEYVDIQPLMHDLVAWYNNDKETPEPIKAALFLYQFVTIHPFNDGNGRTGRALATYILMETGYDMKGFNAMEEYYASDLQGYYKNLQMGLPALYYNGRIKPPHLEQWITYFLEIMALNAEKIYDAAYKASNVSTPNPAVRDLNPQDLKLIRYLIETNTKTVQTKDVAKLFQVSTKTAGKWCKLWCERHILNPNIRTTRTVSYDLMPNYANLVLEDIGFAENCAKTE